MSWYRRQLCDCQGCAAWKAARDAEQTVEKLELVLDQAYANRRAKRAAYEQHLDRLPLRRAA